MQHAGVLSGEVVLLVEDDPMTARELQRELENAGAQVARTSLLAASDYLEQRTLTTAAVLDCHPPSSERRALIRLLRKDRVPILLCSTEPPRDFTTERGALFISKPCPSEKIIAAVRYVCGRL